MTGLVEHPQQEPLEKQQQQQLHPRPQRRRRQRRKNSSKSTPSSEKKGKSVRRHHHEPVTRKSEKKSVEATPTHFYDSSLSLSSNSDQMEFFGLTDTTECTSSSNSTAFHHVSFQQRNNSLNRQRELIFRKEVAAQDPHYEDDDEEDEQDQAWIADGPPSWYTFEYWKRVWLNRCCLKETQQQQQPIPVQPQQPPVHPPFRSTSPLMSVMDWGPSYNGVPLYHMDCVPTTPGYMMPMPPFLQQARHHPPMPPFTVVTHHQAAPAPHFPSPPPLSSMNHPHAPFTSVQTYLGLPPYPPPTVNMPPHLSSHPSMSSCSLGSITSPDAAAATYKADGPQRHRKQKSRHQRRTSLHVDTSDLDQLGLQASPRNTGSTTLYNSSNKPPVPRPRRPPAFNGRKNSGSAVKGSAFTLSTAASTVLATPTGTPTHIASTPTSKKTTVAAPLPTIGSPSDINGRLLSTPSPSRPLMVSRSLSEASAASTASKHRRVAEVFDFSPTSFKAIGISSEANSSIPKPSPCGSRSVSLPLEVRFHCKRRDPITTTPSSITTPKRRAMTSDGTLDAAAPDGYISPLEDEEWVDSPAGRTRKVRNKPDHPWMYDWANTASSPSTPNVIEEVEEEDEDDDRAYFPKSELLDHQWKLVNGNADVVLSGWVAFGSKRGIVDTLQSSGGNLQLQDIAYVLVPANRPHLFVCSASRASAAAAKEQDDTASSPNYTLQAFDLTGYKVEIEEISHEYGHAVYIRNAEMATVCTILPVLLPSKLDESCAGVIQPKKFFPKEGEQMPDEQFYTAMHIRFSLDSLIANAR